MNAPLSDPRLTQPMAYIGDGTLAAVYTVQLLGVSAREKTLFTSVFKLSNSRPVRYAEFDPILHPHPDFFVIDTQDAVALQAFERVDPSAYGGALMIGQPPTPTPHPVLKRPIRWAEVLMRLDELRRPTTSAQLVALTATLPRAAGDRPAMVATSFEAALSSAAGAANELEISQIDQWYDRDRVMTFQTDPAVLVLDPDMAARRYMAAKFIDLQYRVDFAESATQALEMIGKNRYNAVFMESALPDMDGYELCKAIKARPDRRRIAIVFVTQRSSTVERVKGAMAGCDAYLTKPIDTDKLVATLDKFLPNWRMQLPLV